MAERAEIVVPVAPRLGWRVPWTLIVFLAALTLPWVGSRYDTFLGSIIYGQVLSFGILIFPGFSLFSVFALMAVILILRPWGLLGRPLR